ncbi:MAG TPA: glycoside hydrolase family 2 protein [Armatimonadota bacterium]|jgi:beta-mannosidase
MYSYDLGGAWSLTRDGSGETLPAQVPGCVHTDLLANGLIDDPFYRENEEALQWVGETDWTYTRTVDVSAATLAEEQVLLRCEGLDTLATIVVNGTEVARTENMFRTWEFPIKTLLRVGENRIEIRFTSPIPTITARQTAHPIPDWSGPKEMRGRGWLRKAPYHFGWDWGPVLVTSGIWRPIALLAYTTARLDDVHVRQAHHTDGGVTLDIAIAATVAAPVFAQISVALDGKTDVATQADCHDGQAHVELAIPDPQRWWPNGLGAQPLYTVTVELCDAAGVSLDRWTRRIGLRTLRLVREADQWGESFRFEVNGVPFFAKGADWIPADSFSTRVTLAQTRDLLLSAVDAHMNSVRVWGGGIYADDLFYDLCDELGLCVWQDFMFACSSYPAFDDAFMANVRAEAEDNVRRLRHHACLGLWCGNNELLQGLVADSWTEHQMGWDDYAKLFEALLGDVVRTLDPERDYISGSPYIPKGGWRDANAPDSGDAHLWGVWHGKEPYEWYRGCMHRFVSEFGFQSFPEPRTVAAYTAPDDRNVTTAVMEHHQRSGIGNTTIMTYLLSWFRLPGDFDMTLWLSQILQGLAIKYAVEHWRRQMPRTMGAIYWQLNDCWPVASWASIDYYGRWKALQYLAKRFFAPVLLSGVEDLAQGSVDLYVTSDLLTPDSGQLTWTLTIVEGTPLATGTRAVTIAPGQSARVDTLQLATFIAECGVRNLILWLELTTAGGHISRNTVLLARPKHLALCAPDIAVLVTEDGDAFRVTLTATRPALWAWLELAGHEARYTDNFLDLAPGQPVEIRVTPTVPLAHAEFTAALRVRTLVDTYTAVGVTSLVS